MNQVWQIFPFFHIFLELSTGQLPFERDFFIILLQFELGVALVPLLSYAIYEEYLSSIAYMIVLLSRL